MKVLITGAGGFIGGRVAECLWRTEAPWVPRAGLRVWSNGARIGRMPLDMVECDVLKPHQVAEALDEVNAVVHCAVGSPPVIVDGTRNVLAASLEAGVDRFVHLSTVDVYGDATGSVSEEDPLQTTSKEYGNRKIEAEKICREYQDRGLPVVILRPTIVYGPFCEEWVVDFVKRLMGGRRPVPTEDAQGSCNLVYVDDLVSAILAALTRREAVGKAFNINGPQLNLTWNDYFSTLESAVEAPSLEDSPGTSRSRLEAALMLPVRKTAKFVLDNFESSIMATYKRFRSARLLMKKLEHAVQMTPTPREFRYYSRGVTYEIDRARNRLGYQPRYTMHEGVKRTAQWLAFHGYISRRSTEALG